MFKYILTAAIIALFTACSAPKPKHAPSWYTSPPKDFKFFYAVGSGETLTHAKNKAVIKLREGILNDLNSVFTSKSTKIKLDALADINDILAQNERLINTMSMSGLTIDKNEKFNSEELVLIKLPRQAVFDKFSIISDKRLKSSKENYALKKSDDPYIKQYSVLHNGMKEYAKLASIIEAKNITLSTNTLEEINYLNTMSEEYLELKEQISIYVLSDIDSRMYVKGVKDALVATGLELSPKPKSDKALKLLITSNTENLQDYGFNRTKTLVKYTTYDLNKKQVAFRQHTFSAKSRKNHHDAKIQTIAHQGSMIKKLGIFDFIGIK
jgi:hypothetical protein